MKRFVYRLIALVLGAWSALVFAFSPALPFIWRKPVGILCALVLLFSLIRSMAGRFAPLRIFPLLAFLVATTLWIGVKPSNDRKWMPEVARLPWGEVVGETVTLHNVRNFNYRSESDFDPIYDTRVYNVAQLSEVDILVAYWAGKAIAHVMVSFGFNNSDFVAFSIETRKEVGESYSAIDGFFRNYELSYVVADERDVIGVRALHRNPEEQVHLLRTRMALENGRKLFLEYISRINKLRDEPSFYNTLTTNCTTQVLALVRALGGVASYNWKILLSGYVPDYLYETDTLMPGMSLEQIMSQSLVNQRAKQVISDGNFSVLIREKVPHPEPRARPLGGG